MAINRDVRVDYVGRDRTQGAARSVADGAKRIQAQLDKMGRSAAIAQRAFAGLTLGFSVGNAARTLGSLQESLLRVKNLSTDYGRSLSFVSTQTKALNLDLESAAAAYAQIQALQSTGLINTNQAEELFVGFSETAAKFGVSATDVQLALKGLRQALTAGVVRAQEFDQVTDAIGAVLPGVARNLGVTTQELLKMRTSASLSSDAFLKALIPALNEAQGSAALAADNINASFRRLSTAYKEALLEFETPIGNGISQFADAGVAAIESVVENADKIKIVGTAIAAAYGGRALQSVAIMTTAQGKSVLASIAQAKATATNNALLADQARQTLNVARIEQASLVSQRQALQLELAQTQARKARIVLSTQLQAAQAREIAGLAVLRTANQSAAAATTALAASQRAATVSSFALAGATTTLNSALALFGGPAGAATIALGTVAYLGLRQNDLQKATEGVLNATRDLNAEYAKSGVQALTESQARKDDLQREINNLIDQKAKIVNGTANTPLFGTVDEEAALRNLQRQIDAASKSLNQLEIKEDLILDAQRTSDEFEALGNTIAEVADKASAASGFIEKFLPNRAKISELKKALEDARSAFAPDDADGQAVTNAIQDEIDKLSGAAKARKEYTDKVRDARKELDQLNKSLATERERVEATFANAEATILLNVELGTIDSSSATTKITRAREAMNAELAQLDQNDVDATKRALEEKKRLRDQEVADLQQYRNRLIDARSVIDPTGGEVERFRTELLDLNAERGKSIKSAQDYYLLAESARIQHVENMKAIGDELAESQRKQFADLNNYDKLYAVSDVASNFLNAFQKNVGSFIELNESMTDAERKQAIASNAINRKRFEDNKKSSIAQSIISTITGATRAFETVPYPLNFAASAAIAAAGFRNVANIRGSSFGSSSGSVGTGAGISSTGPTLSNEATSTSSEQIPQVVILNGVFAETDPQIIVRGAFKQMAEAGYVADADGRFLDTSAITTTSVKVA